MNLRKLFTSILISLVSTAAMCAYESGNYPITNYTAEEYKAHAQNWKIIQDQNGLIYCANNYGVLTFDGERWDLIKVSNEVSVKALALDSSGKIFVGAENEFGFLSPDSTGTTKYQTLTHLLPKEKLGFGHIWNIMIINEGVFFQTKNQLFHYQNGKLKLHEFQGEISYSFSANNHLYLFILDEGLYKLKGTEKLLVQPVNAKKKRALIIDHHFNRERNYVLYHDDGIYELTAQDSLLPVLIFDNTDLAKNAANLSILPHGQMAVGVSNMGLYVFDQQGNPIQRISEESGLQNATIFSQKIDHHGILWLALSNGLSKINLHSPLSSISTINGLNSTVEGITRCKGKIYLATANGIAYIDNENTVTSQELTQVKYLKNHVAECWDIITFESKQDTFLLYTDNNGVHEIKDGGITSDIHACYPWSLIQSKHDPNRVYVGLEPGLLVLYRKKDRWIVELEIKDLDFIARRVSEDEKGVVWLSSEYDGIARVEFDFSQEKLIVKSMKKYSEEEGIPPGATTVHNGENWKLTGTFKGLYRFNETKDSFEPDTIVGALFKNNSEALVRLSEDPKGNIWLVAFDQLKHTAHLSLIEPPKGMRNLMHRKAPFFELAEFTIYTIYHDKDNVTWLGGPSGLYRYDANIEKKYDLDFNISIRNIRFANDSVLFGGTHLDDNGIVSTNQNILAIPVLNYKKNSLSFEFAAHSYEDTEANLYSYQLDGFTDSWTDWKSETKAVFTNLPEGDYTFRVRALNKYKHQGQEATYSFTILPPWYRTVWAYIGYLLAFVGIVKGAIEISSRSLKAIIDEKTAEVVQQKEEIEAKNATLKQANEEISFQKDIIEEKNQDIMDSINYAEKIQRAILPQEDLRTTTLPNSFVFFRPKDIVSGDFYWIGERDNKVFFTAADCTGHGVPGAFMSMIGTSLLNQTVNEKGITQPSKILDTVKAGVIKSLKQSEVGESKDGMDAALCSLDYGTRILECAGGNNPTYLIRNNKTPICSPEGKNLEISPYLEDNGLSLYEIKADKMPIAYYPNSENPFTNHRIQLEDGDTIYLSSDGFPDQFGGPKGKKFLYKKFKKLLMSIYHDPIEKQGEILEKTIIDWMGEEHEQIDDVCVIGVKV